MRPAESVRVALVVVLGLVLAPAAFADPAANGCRLVPALSTSVPPGFKVFAITAGSIAARIGFSPGDLIEQIDVAPVDPADAAPVYARMKVPGARFTVLRAGQPRELRVPG